MTTPSPSPPPPPPQPPSTPHPPPPTAPAPPAWAKCFNSVCSEKKSKKAWRLRSGEQAELCDPCFATYEEGRFCETFHLHDAGWRCCESCKKRVHCGCIVSVSAFTLLDTGGIECVTCARKHAVVTSSNPTWQPAFYYHRYIADRGKDASVKKLNYLAKSGPVPWRQAPSLFNSSITQTVPHPMIHSEADRLSATEKLSSASLEKGKTDNSVIGNLKHSSGDKIENGHPGPSNVERQSSSIREDSSTSQIGFGRTYTSINETKGKQPGCSTIPIPATSSPLVVQNGGGDAPVEPRPRGRPRGKSQLLPRYWPRFTSEELQRISGKTNAVITPLFEKMLSASDAGRVGRLVLPKKCAETYLPPISQAEGLPLKVHDYTGKEWVFQFRFWPNNNSRMYVLEGVTPCIQSMFLQAGDIVTFSRLDPGGKLVMGFRKAINVNSPSSEYPAISNAQDSESTNPPAGTSGNGEGEVSDRPPWYKVDKSDYIATPSEVIAAKPSSKKRKNGSSVSGSKGKSLKLDSDDLIQLQVTWEESQGLFRPPAEHPIPSSVVSIDGYDFEEFEEAPVIGKPTILATDKVGNKFQWTQCEDCSKWRKIPLDALLPFQWTCSRNLWDLEKASCVADQESSRELLKDLLPPQPLAAPKKLKAAAIPEKDGGEAATAVGGGTDVILEEGGAMTTKHPRHKPGCSCIVCIQPPSGKGPKHKPDCTCTVCEAVKRRFTTQQIKRNERKEAESQQQKQLPPPAHQLPETTGGHDDDDDDAADPPNSGETGNNSSSSDQASKRMKLASSSPFKGQIDLNIQPEREEEALPASDSASTKMLHNVEEMSASRQQKVSSSSSPTYGSDGARQPEQTTSPPNDASQLASKLIFDAALQMKTVSQTYGNDGNNTQQLATGDQQTLVAAGEGKSTESDDSSLAKPTEEALPASASPQQLLDSNLPNNNNPPTPPKPQSTTSLDCQTRVTMTQ